MRVEVAGCECIREDSAREETCEDGELGVDGWGMADEGVEGRRGRGWWLRRKRLCEGFEQGSRCFDVSLRCV